MADMRQALAQLQNQAAFAAARAKEAVDAVRGVGADQAMIRQELERQRRDMQNLANAMSAVDAKGASGQGFGNGNVNDHVRFIESIPGRRIPFDFVVSIPIAANSIQEAQGTKTVSQDGPFVAVERFATFQSAYQFTRRDPVTQEQAAFQGRSFGRFRPVHSAWDLNDAIGGVFPPIVGIAAPGTGAPIVASPSNMSGFRTMEFDGVIEFLNQGSGYFRSNDPVPSSFYTESINSAFQLGALDFFERGETLQWKVRPTHVNNPPAGNLSGFAAGGLFPFLSSQFDPQEGINDQLDPDATEDPIQRLPDGILIIGFHGIKIVQPPGPVRLT